MKRNGIEKKIDLICEKNVKSFIGNRKSKTIDVAALLPQNKNSLHEN